LSLVFGLSVVAVRSGVLALLLEHTHTDSVVIITVMRYLTWYRFQSQYSQRKKLFEKTELKYNYVQSDNIGRSSDAQLRSNPPLQVQPASVPQYSVYAADSSDVIQA